LSLWKDFSNGFYTENPIFRITLGMCPFLALSTSVQNAVGMGAAATFVLIWSNVAISALRNFIPDKIRIPCYIVFIATFVSLVDMVMAAYTPPLHKALGIYIPLIVVNCIILGRAEAFANKNTVMSSFLDGIGMGVGFTLAMILMATIREILGNGTWYGINLLGERFTNQPVLIAILPPGAFILMGYILGVFNIIDRRKERAA
jgi:Na+-translocating ferredoxin:NAD+ oxidoreductase subunit E